MPKKHIIIVTSELVPFHYGGIGTQFKSLAAFLKRHGHRVSLLARRPDNYDEVLYRTHYGETPLFFVDAPSTRPGMSPHFSYAAEVSRRFDETYPEIRPDLVICADFNAEGLFLLLRSGSGAYGGTEFLLTIQGMNHEVISVREGDGAGMSKSIMDLPDIRSLLAMEDLCVHLAPKIVSLTICAWEEIRQRLGIHKTARIIPNMVDLALFHPEKTGTRGESKEPLIREEASSHNGSPERDERRGESEDPLILFVGRLDRMKGTDLLLKAYFEIAERTAPVVPRIVFIGRDCFWNDYGSTFLEHWKGRIPEKYAGAISFPGQVNHDKIRDYLKKAAVAVFPSRWEPFGIVCLEALSMGCPVVVSKGTGLEEVLGPALSEFAVPVTEDIQPLVQKILSLLHLENRCYPDAEFNPGKSGLSEQLRERALEVVRQAEKGWLDLLRDVDRKERNEEAAARPLCGPLHQLLMSLEDTSWRGVAHLQIYFRRQGGYAESDSLRVFYSRLCWTTLKIPLPEGTGERPLRLDPADTPGSIRIRELVLLDEAGTEIWRADGANRFQGCSVGGKDAWSFRKDCLVIEAENDDPQMLLDCPATDRPGELRITIFSGGDP
jgi:glycosyltransferase involved in cell wall biosynthesis